MLQLVLFNVTNGLIIGAFYVLMALGLSLILNLSNVINFAHGNFLALGGYMAFVLTPYIGFWGALLVSPLLTALFGFIIERLMIRRVYSRDPVYSLLLTFGLAFIIQDVCRYIWGPNGLPMTIPDILSTPLSADLFFITWYRIFMVAIVIAAVVGSVRLPALHARWHPHPRRHAGSGHRRRARRECWHVALVQLRYRLPACRAGGRARGRPDRAQPEHGRRPADAQLHRHHCGRRRQPDRHPAGRPADRGRRRA